MEHAQCLLIAASSYDPSSPKKPRNLYGQFAGHTRRSKDEDVFTPYQLCAVGK
jgi:hypothetical protein